VAIFPILTAGVPARADGCFQAPYSCYPPGDIDPTTTKSYADLYKAYAELAWRDFLSLNFPADYSNGEYSPSTTNGLDYNDGDYQAWWETFAEARDIFRPNGIAPVSFGEHDVPDACSTLELKQGQTRPRRVLKDTTKYGDDVLDEYVQANRMGPVIDQNGNYLRYGLNFNETMYAYIVSNVLYTVEGQEAFDANDPDENDSPIDWPQGVYSTDTEPVAGSIFIKSAWKILTSEDDESKFYRTEAYIYNEAGGPFPFSDEPTVTESCSIETVGLVGLHIVHRTNSAPQFIWATFEHVDNAPWLADFANGTPSGSYSLFDASSCPAADGKPSCTFNQLPDHPWNPEKTGQTPSQIVRVAAPGHYAEYVNSNMQITLGSNYGETVWANYFLVDVQFPTVTVVEDSSTGLATENPAYPDGMPTPTFLANSTMETYVQGFYSGETTTNSDDIPTSDQMQNVTYDDSKGVKPNFVSIYNQSGGADRVTSSCVGCHYDAGMVTGANANFVFSLSRAQSTSGNSSPMKTRGSGVKDSLRPLLLKAGKPTKSQN
jgi:hypothetical protein